MIYVIFIIMGLIYGGIYSVLFIRMDELWKKAISVPGEASLFGGIYFGLIKILDVTSVNVNNLFGSLVISFFIGFIIVFIICCILLSKQSEKYKIRVIDIVFGYKKLFENYYNTRQKEIDDELGYEKLKKLKKELDQTKKELNQKEKNLKEKENKIEANIKETPCILLPDSFNMPLENSFIKQIPYYVSDLNKLAIDLDRLTEQFVNTYSEYSGSDNNYLIAYLFGVSKYIIKDIFDSRSVRIHIRYLHNDNYEKLLSCIGTDKISDKLTPIKYGEGMIFRSYQIRRSLIKSLNYKYHKEAKNDEIWEDYLSFALHKICEDDKPILSMGISVKNREHYRDTLYFLNFCKIEEIIQNQLIKFNEKCEIIEAINNINNKVVNSEEAI